MVSWQFISIFFRFDPEGKRYSDKKRIIIITNKIFIWSGPSAVYVYDPFVTEALVRPSKQLKRIIRTWHNWPEANHLALYKRGRGFELGAAEKQIQVVAGDGLLAVVRAGLEPGTAGNCEFDTLTIWPCCLLKWSLYLLFQLLQRPRWEGRVRGDDLHTMISLHNTQGRG